MWMTQRCLCIIEGEKEVLVLTLELAKEKIEFIGGIGGGSFAKRSMVARDGQGGDGFVVDGGISSSKSSRDGEDGGVENKSSIGSRLIATGELIVGDSGGVIIREVGGTPEV
ncbi:hypothetical protein Tco_1241285 [Tanacetum coccineum]